MDSIIYKTDLSNGSSVQTTKTISSSSVLKPHTTVSQTNKSNLSTNYVKIFPKIAPNVNSANRTVLNTDHQGHKKSETYFMSPNYNIQITHSNSIVAQNNTYVIGKNAHLNTGQVNLVNCDVLKPNILNQSHTVINSKQTILNKPLKVINPSEIMESVPIALNAPPETSTSNKTTEFNSIQNGVATSKKGLKKCIPRRKTLRIMESTHTYHSLNKTCREKSKLQVNTIKMNEDTKEKGGKAVFGGGNNTRIIYRVVYPKDFEITEKSKIAIKEQVKRNLISQVKENTKTNIDVNKLEPIQDIRKSVSELKQTNEKKDSLEQPVEDGVKTETEMASTEIVRKKKKYTKRKLGEESMNTVKVTRSGRTVKLPQRDAVDQSKNIKHRTQTFVNVLRCQRCNKWFTGHAKLNRHFAIFPTHKPNNTHSNLFFCFLDIMMATQESDKGYTFVEQLEELIVKIKNMLPCMINNIDSNDGNLCYINEDLGRMLDMEPGKYNISFDEAIQCYENKQEKCKHLMKASPTQMWVAKHNEEIAVLEIEEMDCARTHSVDEWPLIKKRIKKCLPLKMIPELQSSSIVDVTSTNTQNEEVILDDSSGLEKTQMSAVPKDTSNEETPITIFKVPPTIEIPVIKLDNLTKWSKTINSEKTQLNSVLVTPSGQDNVAGSELCQTVKNQDISNFDRFQNSNFNLKSSNNDNSVAQLELNRTLTNDDLSHFDQFQNSHFNIKSTIDNAVVQSEINQTVQNHDLPNFEKFQNSHFNIVSSKTSVAQSEVTHTLRNENLSHFNQLQNSHYNIKSTLDNSVVHSKVEINKAVNSQDLSNFDQFPNSHFNIKSTKDNTFVQVEANQNTLKNEELPHFDKLQSSHLSIKSAKDNVIAQSELKQTVKSRDLSHFEQFQSSHFNIKSSPIKSTNTSFNKIQIKDNIPMFVQLTKEDSLNNELDNANLSTSEDSNIQIDINSMFSELTDNITKESPENSIEMQDSTNKFYNASDHENAAASMPDGFTMPNTSTNICEMAQCHNNLLHTSYLLSNNPAHRSPSDRLLSSDNSINQTNTLVNINQKCGRIENHRSQSDCLLSGGRNDMSKNDRLLSSGNIQLPQSDLLSDSLRTNQSDNLVNLCVNDSNLEGSRMSLPLLDQLGGDCLSFADSELRGSSLDLPLDLFPFSHTE